MTSILDRVARSVTRTKHGRFRPATVEEFFALRLAARLGESASARHYAELAEQYSQGQLLAAYRWALASHLDPARRFHVELEPLRGRHPSTGGGGRLAAIRIERRAVAVAILTGDHLKYADARQLSSSQDKALGTAAGFVTRFLEKFRCASAALEIVPYGQEVQRTLVHRAVLRVLHLQAIGIVEVSKADLLAAFAYPAPHFRGDVRKIISDIYPVLGQQFGEPWTNDAAALGLYVQTERLFNTINQPLL